MQEFVPTGDTCQDSQIGTDKPGGLKPQGHGIG